MTETGSITSRGSDAASLDIGGALPNGQVYIVDDDSMVRRSLSFSLSTAGFKTRVFSSGRDFLDEVDSLSSGCVLLDIRMPETDGLAVLEKLGPKLRRFAIVAMTGHGDVDTAVQAMKRGARDFLEKPFTDAELTAVLAVLFQSLPGHADAEAERQSAIARMALLTPREHDVLQGLVAGLANKTLAGRLGISVRTVEMHRANLMSRMGARSLAEAVRIAVAASVEPR